uniref:Lysine-specific demethylase REF6 n=2 Tax=Kalanchoe fedtschenkoi TaxID=63787 RepID=A0A7N0RJB3_KALFE
MSGKQQQAEVFQWLRALPVAPEYRPTLDEFQDPIAYIFKIEKEASRYGICKIVPPLPPAPRKTVVANFNKSVPNGSGARPTFTTRQQQIGFCPRRGRPVQRPVWQSGEFYTFQEFEAKARAFERSYLKKCGKKAAVAAAAAAGPGLSALEIETLYWKASADKPFSVEYANDMPGSAFAAASGTGRRPREGGEGMTVGDTAWNMKGVARSTMSLLRFMKEDIAGVTSPMVYVAMLFSWFAWHVEDHDLHSLNYLHTGAGKTWYGVPKEAAAGFEEVVRVHGYGGEINPLVTFATLGEKTTVMSPEVFVKAGIPCCRLVQNPGEFVVTFPRAYHSGFSHGFNCGEASNIATPYWLAVAKEAAVRRASINYPPMVSHFQLLYDLAFALCSSLPMGVHSQPRSSRLKQKRKGVGETVVKQLFVEDIKESNRLLQLLGEGLPVVLRPLSSAVFSIYSKSRIQCLLKSRSSSHLGLCYQKETVTSIRNNLATSDINSGTNGRLPTVIGLPAVGSKFCSTFDGNSRSLPNESTEPQLSTSSRWVTDFENSNAIQDNGASDKKLFSCVTCGILCFSCVAIIQPAEVAARYLMASDCSFFSDSENAAKKTSEELADSGRGVNTLDHTYSSGWMGRRAHNGTSNHIEEEYQSDEANSDREEQPRTTALDLLASAYGNSSDSENDTRLDSDPVYADGPNFSKISSDSDFECNDSDIRDPLQENDFRWESSPRLHSEGETTRFHIADSDGENHYRRAFQNRNSTYDSPSFNLDKLASMGSNLASLQSDKDSLRMHVFCLEHAIEVKKKLKQIGGVNMLLLCHPDYPRVEAEAKSVQEELGLDHCWNDTAFRESSEDDERCMAAALESAEDVSSNGDWTVKLGINLFYSASLSRSPLYSKQMPYNSIVYKAFGRVPPLEAPAKSDGHTKGNSRKKKIVLAGKWCGKPWMSNQVHPLLLPPPPALEETQQEHLHAHASAKTDAADSDSIQPVKSSKARRDDSSATTSTPLAGSKRQIVVYSRSNKKTKRAETGLSVSASDGGDADAGENLSNQQAKLHVRSKHKIEGNKKPLEEETRILYYSSKHVAKGDLKSTKETTSLRDLYKPNFKPFGADLDDKREGGLSTRLRRRNTKPELEHEGKVLVKKERKPNKTPANSKIEKVDAKPRKSKVSEAARSRKKKDEEGEFQCDKEGCTMSFSLKQELALHKRDICPVTGCGKTFFSHKYLLQHRRVHEDARPLKCPWKGCKMTFKWAWARTEHIRVHTGVRPYMCAEPGCGQTFRFVSDFSRHKRKTGHSVKRNIKC